MFRIEKNAVAFQRATLKYSVSQTALAIAASLFLPFVIHLVVLSGSLPLGARMLPMFYAPFISLCFFPLRSALACALLAPLLNYLLTGMPLKEKVFGLSLELAVFTLVAYVLLKNFRRAYTQAPCAYLLTQALRALCVDRNPEAFVTIAYSIPGLIILLLINMFLKNTQD